MPQVPPTPTESPETAAGVTDQQHHHGRSAGCGGKETAECVPTPLLGPSWCDTQAAAFLGAPAALVSEAETAPPGARLQPGTRILGRRGILARPRPTASPMFTFSHHSLASETLEELGMGHGQSSNILRQSPRG